MSTISRASSGGSRNSQASVRSRASSRSSLVNGRYKCRSKTSEVDEMLFGSSAKPSASAAKSIKEDEPVHFINTVKLPKASGIGKPRKPETVRVITKDLIRDVVVPSDETSNQIILGSQSYNSLKEKAKETQDLEQLETDAKRAEREQYLLEMQKRKQVMQEYDRKRSEKFAGCNELQMEMKTMAADLLVRSQAQRLEENDEIKHLNELILDAKCHAIRDAQIKEKKDLAGQMKEENDRLDAMMEIDRVQAITQQEAISRRRKEQRQNGAVQIMNQIKTNEIERMLEAEKKDQEARIMVDNQKQLQIQDLSDIEIKKRQQRELQLEIDQINSEHKRQKAIKAEQEKLADERVAEYQRQKAHREANFEAEQQRVRRDKELEITKLRAAQERASDLVAERDALRAKRHEEATERAYRMKAREEAAKKAVLEEDMKIAREDQITAKRQLMAQQAARERAEFDRVLAEQQREVAHLAEKETQKHGDQRIYADDVRNQIREREQQRITERKSFFNETITKDQEMEEKKRLLDQVKRKKLADLKQAGVPEKYVMEVARRIGLPN